MEYYDLGTYTRPVTTSAPEAQTWFDRGLIWAYGFNHEEAVSCFEQALARDPDCAMAYWGVGYAVGPNYNKPWEAFDEADLRTSTERAAAYLSFQASRSPGSSSCAYRHRSAPISARSAGVTPAASCPAREEAAAARSVDVRRSASSNASQGLL